MTSNRCLIVVRISLVAACAVIAGCPMSPAPDAASTVIDGNVNDSNTSDKTSSEPNDTFAQAIAASFDDNGDAFLQGTVSGVGDLDVFSLGPLARGDRLLIDTSTPGSTLDVSIGVFDGDGKLTYNNDDRGGSTSRFLDAYADWIVRHDSDAYFLVVTHSAFADPGTLTGTYSVHVQRSSGDDVPAPTSQLLLLNFDGGHIDSPTLGNFELASFDGGDISPLYEGRTAQMKEIIRFVFEQNYERFNVSILTTDDDPPPPDAKFSIINFGGFNRSVFGIAESVDLYNADYCDDAIIYVETFAANVFSFTPTAEELAVAIGNVGSHEAGHLLGLNHVDDDSALMDDESSADVFILDQEFKEAPLSDDIMSIGTQDDVLLLMESVGPRAVEGG